MFRKYDRVWHKSYKNYFICYSMDEKKAYIAKSLWFPLNFEIVHISKLEAVHDYS